MQLTLQLKRLGKKKVKNVPFTLAETPQTLEDLLIACVKNQVAAFNNKRLAVNVIGFLSPSEIQDQATSGKVDFGDLANKNLADEQEAIDNVRIAFKDGLFLVFIDDEEVTDLQAPLQLTSQSVVAFIRMTFLVGTYW
ncbi:hypothetical protein [Mesonia oceanica]|uniref:Uncharacterized protein n=1 Tax=Mesonia oceanica TaxID=2687242 RepID=A0AC61Y7J3_9FLAO|nr:hypothetical protein [Mesonia oceanica]VVU99344.1 hypothetical protein FVB9532_00596 [Mesonia oceanica]|tara:strand:+ start:4625 stop:5038 length:414 start_codon:yes stop_codon:yes gene_type:complete